MKNWLIGKLSSSFVSEIIGISKLSLNWWVRSGFKFKLDTLGTNLKFYTSVAKGLQLKYRKFWGLIPTFVEVTGKNLVGGPFCPPSWIGLMGSTFCTFELIEKNILRKQLSKDAISKVHLNKYGSYFKFILLLPGDVNLNPGIITPKRNDKLWEPFPFHNYSFSTERMEYQPDALSKINNDACAWSTLFI